MGVKKFLFKKVIFITFLFYIFSCQKEINLELEQIEPKLVVNSLFTEDEPFLVTVEQSSYIYDTNHNYINNATVKVYENEFFIEQLENIDNGRYISRTFPKPNNNYYIQVKCEGFETTFANSYLPPKIFNFSGDISRNLYDSQSIVYHSLNLSITDTYKYANFYMIEAIMDSIYIETLSQDFEFEYVWMSPLVHFHSENIILKKDNLGLKNEEGVLKLFFSDQLFSGKTQNFDIIFNASTPQQDSDFKDIKIYFYNLSEEYYLFLKKKDIIYNSIETSPYFYKTLIQMYSNVENGFGIFAGYNCFVDSI